MCVLPSRIASVTCLKFGIGRCEREVRVRDEDGDGNRLKNYLSVYTTISGEPKVVSR